DQFGGKLGKKMMSRHFKKYLSEIHTKPFAEQHALLMQYHKDWKGELDQVDDILVIGFSL
ncbi:MAG: hypothetical protein ACXVED_18280, partial [Bacteroidia bacterium]